MKGSFKKPWWGYKTDETLGGPETLRLMYKRFTEEKHKGLYIVGDMKHVRRKAKEKAGSDTSVAEA